MSTDSPATVARALGVLATMLGEFDRAEEHFQEARLMAERIGAPPHVARTQVDHARMLRARGGPPDADRADQELAAAAEAADRMGMAGLLAEIDDLRA